jgi:hypothetical protein
MHRQRQGQGQGQRQRQKRESDKKRLRYIGTMGQFSRGQREEVYHLNNGAIVVQVLGRSVPILGLHAHQRLATKRRHERADLPTGKFRHSGLLKVRSLVDSECKKQVQDVQEADSRCARSRFKMCNTRGGARGA